MKFYSEVTKEFYPSQNECIKAEEEILTKQAKEKELALQKKQLEEKKDTERKAAAAKVDEARKAMMAAQKAYYSELEKFCDKYHSYHYTVNSAREIPTLWDWFWNW